MLQMLNTTVGMTIALFYLAVLLFGPFFAVWYLLSVRRELRRIADAQHDVARYANSMLADADLRERIADAEDRRRVANSAFGR